MDPAVSKSGGLFGSSLNSRQRSGSTEGYASGPSSRERIRMWMCCACGRSRTQFAQILRNGRAATANEGCCDRARMNFMLQVCRPDGKMAALFNALVFSSAAFSQAAHGQAVLNR